MKIIRCHIENFGKLSNFTINFNEGYNVICNENGSGKSTLAAFIRVMFYGFEGERRRKGLNERSFYNPWQGGVYGGQLTFRTGGKTYTVSRVFGTKESEDVFELRDAETNSLSPDFSSDIGREIFEIDSESFMRTAFIGSNEIDTEATGDINAKMGNLTDNTQDLTDYDGAAGTVKDLLNRMDPSRKRGSIKQIKDRITVLESEISRERSINRNVDRLTERIHEEKRKIAEGEKVKAEIEKNHKMTEKFREVSVLIEKYDEIEKRYEEAKEQVEAAEKNMNGYIPTEEELDQMQKSCIEMAEAKSAAISSKLRERESERFMLLQQKFGKTESRFMEGEFDRIRGKIDKLLQLRGRQKDIELTSEEKELLGRFRTLYHSSKYLDEETENMEDLYESYKKQKEKAESIAKQLEQRKERGLNNRTGFEKTLNMLGVVAVIVCVFSIVFLTRRSAAGIVFLIIGGAVGAFVYGNKLKIRNDRKKVLERIEQIEEGLRQDMQYIEAAEKELLDYSGEAVINDEKIKAGFREMRLAVDKFRILENKKLRAEQDGGDAECMMIATEIAQFLNKWGVLEDEKRFGDSLERLRYEWEEFKFLREDVGDYEYKKDRYFGKKKKIEEYLSGIGAESSGDFSEQLSRIREKYTVYVQKKEIMDREEERLKAFDHEYNINSLRNLVATHWKEDFDNIDDNYEKTLKDIEEANKRIGDYQREIDVMNSDREVIKEAREELLILYRKKDEETRKFNLLKYTGEILASAKETLTARYSKPLKESYDKYFNILTGIACEGYHIDSNGVLTVKEQGMQRDVSSFSAGYRDMMGLCMRLAFIDVMYPGEKPMIILDDPFVNLDKPKVAKGRELLDKIAEEYQVIYLTCNEDRR